MKYFLPTILLCLCINLIIDTQTLFGQASSVFERYEPDNGFSPYASRLPGSFLPFIDNEYQRILFNPAYLAEIDESQIYTTLEPGSASNIRFAVILPERFLLTVSYRDNTNFFDEITDQDVFTVEVDSNSFGEKRIRSQTATNNSFEEGSNTTRFFELGLAKLISNTENRSRSLRLLFSFSDIGNDRNTNGIQQEETDEELFRNDTLLVRSLNTNNRTMNRVIEDGMHKFHLSLEYSSLGNSSESKHSLFVQNGSYGIENSRFNYNRNYNLGQNFELATMSQRIRIQETDNEFTNKSGQLMLGYDGYINRTMNWLGDDFMFATLNGYYTFGDADLLEKVTSRDSLEDNGSLISTNMNSNELFLEDKNGWKARGGFGLGYVINFEVEDFSFFTGFNPSFFYIKSNYYNPGNSIIRTELEEYSITGMVPLFADLKITDHFGIWGGGILSYSYSNENRIFEREILNANPNLASASIVNIEDENDKEFRSSQTNFFGVRATHKSGLKLLADINGDLTRLSGWRITIGYSF